MAELTREEGLRIRKAAMLAITLYQLHQLGAHVVVKTTSGAVLMGVVVDVTPLSGATIRTEEGQAHVLRWENVAEVGVFNPDEVDR